MLCEVLILDTDRHRFLIAIYSLAFVLYGISYLVLPAKTQQFTLQPSRGIFHATTYLLEHGPVIYLREFHTLGLDASGRTTNSMIATTEYLTGLLQSAEILPFNDALAEYASTIRHNKHGPFTAFLIAPFLFVFGSSPVNAILASCLITATLPVIVYFVFKIHFADQIARVGSLFLLLSPSIFIYLREKTIPYDPILSVLTALATYFVLSGLKRQSRLHVGVGGVVFSLAALTKVSVLPLAASFVLIIFISLDIREALLESAGLAATSLALPVTLVFVGYNFVLQYMYAIARLFINAQDFNTNTGSNLFIPPGINFESPLLALMAIYYNIRLLGLPLLALVGFFILYAILERQTVLSDQRYLIGLAFLVALLPFLPQLQLQFARHMLAVFVAIGYIGVCALSILQKQLSPRLWTRFVQLSLLITIGLTVVNL